MTIRALILVDIQNDFCPGGALAVPGGDEVVGVANRLMAAGVFDVVVATRDWHPAGHGSFASRHAGKAVGDTVDLAGLPQFLWPDHCVQSTRGAEFAVGLNRARIDAVIHKGVDPDVDSYSGFFDNARRHATGLADTLRQRNVTDVYIMGLATDYCVKATALDAASLGFRTHLLLDGCRGVNVHEGDVDQAVEDMSRAGVAILTSENIR